MQVQGVSPYSGPAQMQKHVKLTIAVVIILIVVIAHSVYSHKPQFFFRKPVAGDLADVAATQLYYSPPWLGALSGSPALIDVLKGCRKDPACAAVVYTQEEQEAAKHGFSNADYCLHTPNPPECVATAYPFQLSPGVRTVYYTPKDPSIGPNLYVKRQYGMRKKA
jgi:hypothetical protein